MVCEDRRPHFNSYRVPFLPFPSKPGFLELPPHGPGRSSGAKLVKFMMLDGPLKRAHQSRNGLHTKLTLAQLPPRKITSTTQSQRLQWSYGYMWAVGMGQKSYPTQDNMDGLILFFYHVWLWCPNLTQTQRTPRFARQHVATPPVFSSSPAVCLSPLWRVQKSPNEEQPHLRVELPNGCQYPTIEYQHEV